MRFSVYQITRRGGREKNEDRMGYCYTRNSGLFALADGMGGHPEGEVASQMSLQTLAAMFQQQAKPVLPDVRRFLTEAILVGHHDLIRYATEKALLDTPRTTLVACVLQGQEAYWAHCGDSRLYLVRDGKLMSRTRDHSYAELQETLAGLVPLGDRVNRNMLFTCLGSPGKPVVDIAGPVQLQRGDKFLLCSDGLWGPIDDDTITGQLARKPISEATPDLVELALQTAGEKSDNVTVISVEWESAEDDEPRAAIETEGLGDDDFASTIQAAGPGIADDLLDDEEIERSIREINEAIRRSAQRKP
jgi:PPM family protein phosphatase